MARTDSMLDEPRAHCQPTYIVLRDGRGGTTRTTGTAHDGGVLCACLSLMERTRAVHIAISGDEQVAVVVSPEAWAPIAAPEPRDSSRVSSSTLVLERKRVSFVHSLNLPNTEPQKRKLMATITYVSVGSPFASREGKSEG